MNRVAGTITFKGEMKLTDFSFNYVLDEARPGVMSVFVYGNTEVESSEDFVNFMGDFIDGDILSVDISISTEEKVKIIKNEYLTGEYVLKTIQGKDIFFETVVENDKADNVVAIRQAEVSDIFGNKIIKIDCLI